MTGGPEKNRKSKDVRMSRREVLRDLAALGGSALITAPAEAALSHDGRKAEQSEIRVEKAAEKLLNELDSLFSPISHEIGVEDLFKSEVKVEIWYRIDEFVDEYDAATGVGPRPTAESVARALDRVLSIAKGRSGLDPRVVKALERLLLETRSRSGGR